MRNRNLLDLRPISVQLNEWGQNTCLWTQGNTQVYAGITLAKSRHAEALTGKVKFSYIMYPFAGEERIKPKQYNNRRSLEIAHVCKEFLESIIFLNEIPGTEIHISGDVIKADGSTRAAVMNAVGTVLPTLGIAMRGYPVTVTVGKVDNDLVVDVDYIEDSQGHADLVFGFVQPTKGLGLLQFEGCLTVEEFKRAFEIAENKAEEIYYIQKKTIEEHV